jgi:hypothetical protein
VRHLLEYKSIIQRVNEVFTEEIRALLRELMKHCCEDKSLIQSVNEVITAYIRN